MEDLTKLQQEHRDMDEAIKILEMSPRNYYDHILELKRKKLKIKEKIEKAAKD